MVLKTAYENLVDHYKHMDEKKRNYKTIYENVENIKNQDARNAGNNTGPT